MKSNFPLFIHVLFLFVLSGCASLPSTKIENVNQRTVEYAQINSGEPVVVFENGFGASMTSWSKVFAEIGADVTVFAYNRAGYGNSGHVSTSRDGDSVVEDLRALLRSRGLRPPYILVGHSLGGLYMQLFARKYPDEIVGLVLVDSSHPSQFTGPGATENWPLWAKFFKLFLNESQLSELETAEHTGKQILQLPTVLNKPIFILSAREKSNSDSAKFFNEKRADLVRLYPGARQIWVDSGHSIQNEKPEVVIGAIKDIAARASQPSIFIGH